MVCCAADWQMLAEVVSAQVLNASRAEAQPALPALPTALMQAL